jgi:hypothetical protein
MVRTFENGARLLLIAGLVSGTPACNSLLGIGEPSDEVLEDQPGLLFVDSGGFENLENTSNGVDAGVSDAGAADAGRRLPPAHMARALWTMPNSSDSGLSSPQKYEVNASGVVRDTWTSLEWQQKANRDAMTFAEAETYCSDLPLDGGKFRLPSRVELASLLDLSEASPALNHTAFPDERGDRYWTSSGYALAPDSAWVVSFSFSTSHVVADLVDKNYVVRCVRSEKTTSESASALEVDDVLVVDPDTGLEWQRESSAKAVSLDVAKSGCRDLKIGTRPFRLPTPKELMTIVDESKARPAIDADAFPGTPSASFWTQTTVVNFDAYTWTVNFMDGSDIWVSMPATAYYRCVRSAK